MDRGYRSGYVNRTDSYIAGLTFTLPSNDNAELAVNGLEEGREISITIPRAHSNDTTDRFNVTICQSINQASYDWAPAQASATALKRFSAHGQPYVFVPDKWSGILLA